MTGYAAYTAALTPAAANPTVKDRPNESPGAVANRLLVTLLITLSAPLFLGGLVAAGELGDARLLALGTLAVVATGALVLGGPRWRLSEHGRAGNGGRPGHNVPRTPLGETMMEATADPQAG
jgi:hypothetical protein